MAYFPDLTPYSYWGDQHRPDRDEPWPDLPLLNVGWLDTEHPFPMGTCPDGLVPALERLGRARVMQTADFCAAALASA